MKRVKSDEECFRLKPKRGTKANKQTDIKCEFDACSEKEVDRVKCNMCAKWVCESCNDVPEAKLKPIMNKCSTTYFICKKCDESVEAEATPHSNFPITEAGNTHLLNSLQNMFDKKVSQLESEIENSIEKKLGEKMETVNSLVETIKSRDEQTSEEKTSYAKILNVPKEVRKTMLETQNDDKVELVEQEKRCKNFIIHGAEEVGNNDDEIKVNDEQYLIDILTHIGINTQPDKVIRLGRENENKALVLRVVMPSKSSKDGVMTSLGCLKGTEEDFGKISVTDDYTAIERQKIKDFADKVREQSKKDNTRVFKVRGDPKNGLRMISFKKN